MKYDFSRAFYFLNKAVQDAQEIKTQLVDKEKIDCIVEKIVAEMKGEMK